jgi:hypothetical protein
MSVPTPSQVRAMEEFSKATGDRKKDNPMAGGIVDKVTAMMAQRDMDKKSLQAMFVGITTVDLAVTCALSLLPLECNFGSFFSGITLSHLTSPIIRGVYEEPTMEWIRRVIPTRHLSPRIFAQGLAIGAFTDDQVRIYAMNGGLMDEDVNALVQLAQVQRFNNNVKADIALLQKYQTLQLDAEIADRKQDLRDQLADKKAELKEAQKALAQFQAGAS